MFSALTLLGIIGAIYVLAVLIISVMNFNDVREQFLKKTAPFFAFSLLTMILVALLTFRSYIFLALVTSEFLLMLTLFYSYLRSNIYFLSVFAISPYFEDVMVILSIYFSLYITGSILQAKSQERKGSFLVTASFLLMDISLLLQAFYILELDRAFMQLGVSLFVVSVILFLLPFLLGGFSKND
ncbi:MAG: hypothetical protein QW100_02950 [Thermoplasmatales archaeon]